MENSRMKHFVLFLAVLSIVMMWGGSAAALDVELGGQVNHMVMFADDGDEDNSFIADNDNSSTRFKISGEEDFGNVKTGFKIELEAQRNASNRLTMDQVDDGDFEFNERWLEAYFTGDFGSVEIGKGDGAANGTTEVDLSGTSVINFSDINATAKSFIWKNSDGSAFRNQGGEEDPDYLNVGDTRDNFDGLSRNERVRYNTPDFGGIMASLSLTNGEAFEVAGNYDGEIAGQKLGVALGYIDGGDRKAYSQYGGSISWLAPFGLNLTAAYGMRQYDEGDQEDPTNMYLKVGYKWSNHALSVEYGLTSDLAQEGDESSNYGLAYVVKPWKPVELYASYRMYMLETDDQQDPEDISQFMAGTRIKF